ncbi:DKNYY domain-containing protein [uncultured Campylobacter sp.]|uniref:DKNYY domain-containing protein n=1 Tax=uncultured Campylobacter sp. TaxID=218934 RepID=UPI00262A6B5A|nr:DKNYY domain-containing protein [uncultured Campylobacter sp.]
MKKADNLSKFDKKALKLLFAVLFVPLFVSLVFIYELSVYDRLRELPAYAQKIGRSDYYNIGGKIYLRSWNFAPYELEGGADAASFRALDTGRYSYTNVGMDASSVFCGARKMSGLDPARTQKIGSRYYSDGRVSYFCSDVTQRTGGAISYIYKVFFHAFGLSKWPQEYNYPYARLDTSAPISPLTESPYVATDGEQVFYEGKILEGADAKNLKQIRRKIIYEDGPELPAHFRLIDNWLSDGRSVYKGGERLNFTPNEQMYLMEPNAGIEFLFDPTTGAVFMDGERFDAANEPYTPLNFRSGHQEYMLFASKNGIFYLSKDKILNRPRGSDIEGRIKDALWYVYYKFGGDASRLSALKRAGDNPFKGAVRQISEKLLKDDAGFYYLNFYSHSVYVTGRSGRHLDKRTNFIELRKITLDVHDDEVMAQIADEAARNSEMSQQVFTAQDVEYENGAAFYMYCLAVVLLLGAWIYSHLRKRSLRRG